MEIVLFVLGILLMLAGLFALIMSNTADIMYSGEYNDETIEKQSALMGYIGLCCCVIGFVIVFFGADPLI